MTTAEASARIYGDKIFFNFIEVPASKLGESGDLVRKIKDNEIQGFLVTDFFSEQEISEVLRAIEKPVEEAGMKTSTGKVFPAPFAIITDSGERLDTFYNQLQYFNDLIAREPAVKNAKLKMDSFFKAIGTDFKASVPVNAIKKLPVSAGGFRVFMPEMGGLFVHCGNLFQCQSEHYYSLLENDIDMNDQMSFFWLLQNAQGGGELTIYDMLWKDVKRKVSSEENDSVIDDTDKTIYLKDVPSFTVRPKAGDVLVFSGGPIWHRVENIKGAVPRITYGGFINFSNDGKEIFYWA